MHPTSYNCRTRNGPPLDGTACGPGMVRSSVPSIRGHFQKEIGFVFFFPLTKLGKL